MTGTMVGQRRCAVRSDYARDCGGRQRSAPVRLQNGKCLPAISHRADYGCPGTTAAQLTASTDIAKNIDDRLRPVKASPQARQAAPCHATWITRKIL